MQTPTHPPLEPALSGARPRLETIDLVRGLVMILMVLDHVRDFFAGGVINPRDVTQPALFLTRWITHFCAPTFVLLAGASAYLFGVRAGSRRALAWFLLTRGLWLIVLEVTVVRVGFMFRVFPEIVFLQVIWAIGCGMVLLAGLVYLPRWAIAAVALALIGGHHLVDGVRAADAGVWWHFLHEPNLIPLSPRIAVLPLYSLIPWVGVLAGGYALGPLFTLPAATRARRLAALGVATLVLFVVLRALDVYGDPAPRAAPFDRLEWLLAFVNCEKYPPSLAYLTMTLGPALLALAAAERARGAAARILGTFGRVPTFFYVAHIYVIHAAALAYVAATGGDVGWLFGGMPPMSKPPEYGLSLAAVYGVWIVVVAALYAPSRWFAGIKQRRRAWWLSYL